MFIHVLIHVHVYIRYVCQSSDYTTLYPSVTTIPLNVECSSASCVCVYKCAVGGTYRGLGEVDDSDRH
jgi:hypothetical protein